MVTQFRLRGVKLMDSNFRGDNKLNDSYFFISYPRSCYDKAYEYVSSMEKYNIKIWWDRYIGSAEDWENELTKHIEGCQAVIMLLFPEVFSSQRKSNMHKEYNIAHHFGKTVHCVLVEAIDDQQVTNVNRWWWEDIKNSQYIKGWEYSNIDALVKTRFLNPNRSGTRNQFANDKDQIVLETYSSSLLPYYPANFWLVRLYVCAVKNKNGKRFIPLKYTRYGGIWSTPHIAFQFQPPPYSLLCEVLDILHLFDSWVEKESNTIESLGLHQLYQLGMFSPSTIRKNTYTEFKPSPTSKGQYNCFRVEEYHLNHLKDGELVNIYDPEKLFGYRYFPLDEQGNADFSSKYVEYQGGDILFFGKKLSTNIVALLNDNRHFEDCTYDLPADITINEFGVSQSNNMQHPSKRNHQQIILKHKPRL